MERVDLELGEAAREAGLFVVSALGFDCVPGDLGAQEAAALFVPPSRCTWVESFVSLHCSGNKGFGGNFATYESAVYGFANAPQLTALRRQVWQGHAVVPHGAGSVSLKCTCAADCCDSWQAKVGHPRTET